MDFSAHLVRLDAAIEDRLCDGAAYLPQGVVGAVLPARVLVERPSEAQRLEGSGFVRARPVLQVAVLSFPILKQGDVFIMGQWLGPEGDQTFIPGVEAWRLAEAPRRPGDGRWWSVEVEAVEVPEL